jgi:hypothetical protein
VDATKAHSTRSALFEHAGRDAWADLTATNGGRGSCGPSFDTGLGERRTTRPPPVPRYIPKTFRTIQCIARSGSQQRKCAAIQSSGVQV